MLRFIVVLGWLILFNSPLHAKAQDGCGDFFSSSRLAKFKADLQQVSGVGSIWQGYSLANETIILTDSTVNAACVVVLRKNAEIARLKLASELVFRNGRFAFYYSTLPPSVPADLKTVLDREVVPLALLFNLGAKSLQDYIGAHRAYLAGMSDDTYRIYVALHEGFHLAAQNLKWVGLPQKHDWPAWDILPDRDAVIEKCYEGTKITRDLVRKESQALNDGVKLLLVHRKPGLVASALNEFFESRRRRYEALSEVRVPSDLKPEGYSCPEAEAIMELEEGVPDYVAFSTLSQARKMRLSEYLEYASTIGVELFYQFGSLQLLLLKGITHDRMPEVIASIVKSENYSESIGYHLRKESTLVETSERKSL